MRRVGDTGSAVAAADGIAGLEAAWDQSSRAAEDRAGDGLERAWEGQPEDVVLAHARAGRQGGAELEAAWRGEAQETDPDAIVRRALEDAWEQSRAAAAEQDRELNDLWNQATT